MSFKDLAVEILLQIFTYCDDLSSICILSSLSRRAHNVVGTYAREIIELALQDIPYEKKGVMIAVLKVRLGYWEYQSYRMCKTSPLVDERLWHSEASKTVPPVATTEVDEVESGENWKYIAGMAEVGDSSDIDDSDSEICTNHRKKARNNINTALSIPEKASASILRRFMHLAYQIHVLAHNDPDECLNRLKSIQPFDWSPPDEILGEENPSWREEQLAQLSLWRLQLYFEFQQARLYKRLPWSIEALEKLENSAPADLYEPAKSQVIAAQALLLLK